MRGDDAVARVDLELGDDAEAGRDEHEPAGDHELRPMRSASFAEIGPPRIRPAATGRDAEPGLERA